jgi:hypothetical protein
MDKIFGLARHWPTRVAASPKESKAMQYDKGIRNQRQDSRQKQAANTMDQTAQKDDSKGDPFFTMRVSTIYLPNLFIV